MNSILIDVWIGALDALFECILVLYDVLEEKGATIVLSMLKTQKVN